MEKENFLEKLNIVLDKKNIPENEREPYINFFSMYKSGEILYPGVAQRNLRQCKAIIPLLDSLVANGICELFYRYYCPCCQKEVGKFKTREEIDVEVESDDEVYCDECDTLLGKENVRICYRFL